MNPSASPERSVTWRRVLGLAWVLLVAALYFARQVAPQWRKVHERFIAPLLGR